MKLEKLSALELGKLVNNKIISPVEVIEYFYKRIQERDRSLNAFSYVEYYDALYEAKMLEAEIMSGNTTKPLAGVPVCLKDFLPSKKGWTHSYGGIEQLVEEDKVDSEFYIAAKKAGAIAIGKTNSPPFGFSGTCSNAMAGPTRNPFDLTRNSGGSSGGTAAAVADGLVLLGEGGDAGGSIRIPSAWCGCYGLKPGLGTVPNINRPDGWSATHPYCVNGAITKTVEDSAIMLYYLRRYDPKDPNSTPVYSKFDYLSELHEGIDGMKIGLTYGFDIFPHDSYVELNLDNAARVLVSAGAEVEPVTFNFKYSALEYADMWCKMLAIDTAIDMENWKDTKNVDLIYNEHQYYEYEESIPRELVNYVESAYKLSIFDMRKFNEMRTEILDEFNRLFYEENYDLILSPVTVCPPVENKGKFVKGPENWLGTDMNTVIGFAETFLVNFTGHPAASVPTGLVNGLPFGAQLIGKQHHEYDILKASYVMEKLNPWSYDIPENRNLEEELIHYETESK